jgi:hypothetical protein
MDWQGLEIREALSCGFQGVGGAFVELDDAVYRTRQGPEYPRHIEHAAPERGPETSPSLFWLGRQEYRRAEE